MVTSPLVDFEKLRVTTVTAPDGRTLLLHSDACRALGIRNTTQALDRLVPEERMTAREVFGPKGTAVWLITVGGWWRLALSTRRKSAETLRTLICRDILPALTDSGTYTLPEKAAVRSDLEAEARCGRLSRALSRSLQALDGQTITREV